ncbi:hypothetical protein C7H19_03830 [Aphanothece hegewaldii CCALA 016]|uniref:RuBisCO accumulation factor 1 n=1 Tax=Aphanothece hegewaldii CCALA 016 TaxID=2107694 RepID=A0A2T1M1R6_9CHRO|nr:RuBisCO accumulation factor 1 [Aphanothece hegewaldii]PSF38647.1 hypothetical protein C7H19_03830 [Aphanothece hegewaldii CCALA 016]
MTENPLNTSLTLSDEEVTELIRSLLHKEGSWVDWGKKCQKLQKAGYLAQDIFEQTGFQTSQQNLIIVAAQVYDSLLQANVSEDILAYCRGPRSDVLYEFRILNQDQRAAAVELAYHKRLEADEAKDAAKAIQEFFRLSQVPADFTKVAGDAVAYQCWKRARQIKDLQDRSRLIAKGLRFAQSATSRQAIERLLSDFTITSSRSAPLLPLHRLEEEEELSRVVGVVGKYPITKQELESVDKIIAEEPFGIITYSGSGRMVALPGWQAVLKAIDPVVIVCNSEQLPINVLGKTEEVLVIVERVIKQWDVNSYFLVEQENKLIFQWFEEEPTIPLLGQVILVLRPKRILDENNLIEPWQMDD